MKGPLGFMLLLGVCAFGCHAEGAAAEPIVEVGIFFGGQVQRVKKVEVPPVHPPKIGFRVVFPEGVPPESRSGVIEFEIVRPGPAGRRVTKKGTLRLLPGQDQIDQVFNLTPTDKFGVWNVRVVQNETVLADRALYLVKAPAAAP